ncbi:unannotated protein [freshwater metagenome]|uniref:Unannotated protein n=1 Tax=freshwater metagenome TaxID=449393 RepID=A0A6J6TXW3_9ZZZZ
MAARSEVHSRMNCNPHQRNRGFNVGLTRMEVFSPNKERNNIFGAAGDAQAKQWPGAIKPALTAVASAPTCVALSTTTTS